MDSAERYTLDVFVHARHIICSFLQPEAAAMLYRQLPALTTLEDALKYIFVHQVPGHNIFVSTPADFISATTELFTDVYLAYFAERAARFDQVSGYEGNPSNTFLQSEPLSVLLELVAEGMAATAEKAAAAEVRPRTVADAAPLLSGQVPSLLEQAPSAAGIRTAEQEEHGASGLEESPACPITDIALIGPTIRAAWSGNAITKGIEDAASVPIRQNPLWAPTQMTHLPVYHGTAGPRANQQEFAWRLANFDTAPAVLQGSVSPNQVAPENSALPIVWTSFSPLRSFLWACFVAEVLSNIPPTSVRMTMANSYACPRQPRHIHRGVRLLEFRSHIFNSNEMRAAVMPRGVEDEWARIAQQSATLAAQVATHSNTTNGIWGIFSRLHGDTSGASWPEVLHCHETSQQSAMLQRFTKQHWRTVWYGAGVAELNRGCQNVFSISLEIETPPNNNPIPAMTSPKDMQAAKGQGSLSKRL